jgi:UDP-N-acetylmuramoylalanine--D-glutamate ligase
VLRALQERGVRWISEPELAVRFFTRPLIAITGTNGKTTTTLLVAHLLEASGVHAAVGGNVGGGFAPAACELALRPEAPDWYVLEMSSFQLGAIDRFRPDIGVVTNLSPDHQDWYGSVEAYYADKARLFDNADASSRWVLPAFDSAALALGRDAPGTRYLFGASDDKGVHAFERGGMLTLDVDGAEALIPPGDLPLLGRHNHLNALAAALVARLAGADAGAIAAGLRTARPLPHRMEPVAEKGGVLWVNDSKATNVAAARSALESLSRPVLLLLGGKDKGEDFGGLRSALGHVRVAVVFGAAGDRIAREIDGAVEIVRVDGTLADVVRVAAGHARDGDVVLLSPACSSYDMFDNYEDRGHQFAALARDVA